MHSCSCCQIDHRHSCCHIEDKHSCSQLRCPVVDERVPANYHKTYPSYYPDKYQKEYVLMVKNDQHYELLDDFLKEIIHCGGYEDAVRFYQDIYRPQVQVLQNSIYHLLQKCQYHLIRRARRYAKKLKKENSDAE